MGLEDFLQQLLTSERIFSFWEVTINASIAFALSLLITQTYKSTHVEITYSRTFCTTLIMLGISVSAIMMIIGSNIARAFSLVGALSVVRFRTAVKDSRDTAFVFFTMAAGMSAGTGFYLVGTVYTLLLCGIVVLLHRGGYGQKVNQEKVLRIRFGADADYEGRLAPIFTEFTQGATLMKMETVMAGTAVDLVYNLRALAPGRDKEFVTALRDANENNKISLFTENAVDV